MKEFNREFENLSYEELYDLRKESIINYCNNLKKLNDNELNIKIERTLNNIDEATKESLIADAKILKNCIDYLNICAPDRNETQKETVEYENTVTHIFEILDGFGDKSKNLFTKIINSPKYDSNKGMKEYASFLGYSIQSDEEKEKMLEVYTRLNAFEDIAELKSNNADFIEQGLHLGLLEETKEEFIERMETSMFISK